MKTPRTTITKSIATANQLWVFTCSARRREIMGPQRVAMSWLSFACEIVRADRVALRREAVLAPIVEKTAGACVLLEFRRMAISAQGLCPGRRYQRWIIIIADDVEQDMYARRGVVLNEQCLQLSGER